VIIKQDAGTGDCRLVFHVKALPTNGQTQAQCYVAILRDVVQSLLPGTSHVRFILQARTPVIKYHQDLTGLECGLSMTKMYVDLQYSSVILMYVK
jgi:hypothetical protein